MLQAISSTLFAIMVASGPQGNGYQPTAKRPARSAPPPSPLPRV